jgi:predicted DNA-binding transcriptional regulator YafY
MRAARLLSALLLLQMHRRMSGRALAERLEVSVRTVHRDMEALSAAGVPVLALRGAQGGWMLDENWHAPVAGLDEAELRALLMAQPRMAGDAALAAAAESALGKLVAALPAALQDRAASIRQRLYVDTAGWRASTENLDMLPVVQDAVARDRKLAIRYRKPTGEVVERTVDPLGLVAKGSTWYLFGGTAAGSRTYRVSRIEEARILDEACARPAKFDLASAWRQSVERLRGERPRVECLMRLDAGVLGWFQRWQRTVPESESTAADGRVTLRVQFEREEEAVFVTLGLGHRAELLEPAGLRQRVAEEVATHYRMIDK